MSGELEKAQDVFLNGISQMCDKFGLNNIMAQLYAVLYINNKPMSLDDMVERLKISKGSASINIRSLERYGVVTKIWVKGSRKDYYEAEADISKVIIDRIKAMAEKRLSEVEGIIRSADRAISSVGSQQAGLDQEALDIFRKRVEKLAGLQRKAKTLFDLVNSNLLDAMMDAGAAAAPAAGNAKTEELTARKS